MANSSMKVKGEKSKRQGCDARISMTMMKIADTSFVNDRRGKLNYPESGESGAVVRKCRASRRGEKIRKGKHGEWRLDVAQIHSPDINKKEVKTIRRRK